MRIAVFLVTFDLTLLFIMAGACALWTVTERFIFKLLGWED